MAFRVVLLGLFWWSLWLEPCCLGSTGVGALYSFVLSRVSCVEALWFLEKTECLACLKCKMLKALVVFGSRCSSSSRCL